MPEIPPIQFPNFPPIQFPEIPPIQFPNGASAQAFAAVRPGSKRALGARAARSFAVWVTGQCLHGSGGPPGVRDWHTVAYPSMSVPASMQPVYVA